MFLNDPKIKILFMREFLFLLPIQFNYFATIKGDFT